MHPNVLPTSAAAAAVARGGEGAQQRTAAQKLHKQELRRKAIDRWLGHTGKPENEGNNTTVVGSAEPRLFASGGLPSGIIG